MQADQITTAIPLWKRLVFGRDLERTLLRAFLLAVLTIAVFRHVLLPVRVSGISMEPTYYDGKVNLVNRFSYFKKPPGRGDVVAIRTSGYHIMYLKRIIALPGETIAIKDGVVFIDGSPLSEPYLVRPEPWNIAAKKLGADEYFLIGDNRRMPQELHSFGVTGADHIMGKVLW